MSISKAWVGDPKNQRAVMGAYRSRTEFLTLEKIAERLGTTFHNVAHVVKVHMPEAERKALAKVRYSASKTGTKNPMAGKTGENHHNWIGICEDGYGYLTCLYAGKRRFVHNVVMMKALGVKALPVTLEIHHIDTNPKNNELDNLALVTKRGHKTIHYLQVKDSKTLRLKKLSIADALKSMI